MARNTYPRAGEYEVKSHPIFSLVRGDDVEILVLDATLHIRTADARASRSGRRQVSIEVTDWVARGHSDLLDSDVTMQLTGTQRGSSVAATQVGADFPATLRFNMNYQVEVNGGARRGNVIGGLRGTAVGKINAFPPQPTDIFQIRGKDLTIGGITMQSLACAC
jgi:hypothetical protein